MRATDGISRIVLPREAVRGWPVRQALAASIVFALLLGVFLAIRRLSGAAAVVLPPSQLLAVAVLLLAWATVVRALVPGQLAAWLTAGVLLLFAIACSFPGEGTVDWLVWLTVFGTYVASHNVIAVAPAKLPAASKLHSPAMETDHVLQHLKRSRTVEGQDTIHGTLLAEFAPGERSVTLYVAFCPPFERLPQVELESSADARLIQALHNGAQIEVRLPRAATTPMSVAVEFYAADAE